MVKDNIVGVELYVMFSTDTDFHVNLDGLEMFVRSRLYDDAVIYYFSARKIPLDDFEHLQLIKLSVQLPMAMWGGGDKYLFNNHLYFDRGCWMQNAVKQILLPAYMWLFAEIGIANPHSLPKYYSSSPFDALDLYGQTSDKNSADYIDGVKTTPRHEIMSGNYKEGWAQFRFILQDARNFGGSTEYEDAIRKELEELHAIDE